MGQRGNRMALPSSFASINKHLHQLRMSLDHDMYHLTSIPAKSDLGGVHEHGRPAKRRPGPYITESRSPSLMAYNFARSNQRRRRAMVETPRSPICATGARLSSGSSGSSSSCAGTDSTIKSKLACGSQLLSWKTRTLEMYKLPSSFLCWSRK